jgi:hypothetical protein
MRNNEEGKVGWIILLLLGVPIPTVAEYLLSPSQCRSVNGKDKSTRLTALN